MTASHNSFWGFHSQSSDVFPLRLSAARSFCSRKYNFNKYGSNPEQTPHFLDTSSAGENDPRMTAIVSPEG
jgi:hypothetical protein